MQACLFLGTAAVRVTGGGVCVGRLLLAPLPILTHCARSLPSRQMVNPANLCIGSH